MNFSVLLCYCDWKWFECFRILALVLWKDFLWDFPLKQKGFCESKPASKMQKDGRGSGSGSSQAVDRLHSFAFHLIVEM